jgi:hypothetical protein
MSALLGYVHALKTNKTDTVQTSMQPKQSCRNSEYAMDWTIRCSIPDSGNIFLFSKNVQSGSEVHPVSHPMCTGALSSGVKRAKRTADQSLQFSAEVKNEKRYSCISWKCAHSFLYNWADTRVRLPVTRLMVDLPKRTKGLRFPLSSNVCRLRWLHYPATRPQIISVATAIVNIYGMCCPDHTMKPVTSDHWIKGTDHARIGKKICL